MNPKANQSKHHEIVYGIRDAELVRTDWTQGADASNVLSADEIAAYATYRQQLRDLPQQEGFPNVEIPQYVAPPEPEVPEE